MTEPTLGDRLAQVRRRRSLTQEELAERAGVSVDTIFKLEQNQRKGARVSTIHALARGLDVKTSELFEGGTTMENEDEGQIVNLLPLRRLLVPGPLASSNAEEPPPLTHLRGLVVDVTRLYHRSRYQEVITELPSVVSAATAAAVGYDGDDRLTSYRLLAHVYTITGSVLIQLRYEDLAADAIRLSMEAATQAGDEVLHASGARYYTWIFTRQGRFDDAETISVRMAESIEPSISKSTPLHLSVWGRLLTGASSAAARNNRPDTARELLTLARTSAARIEQDRMDYGDYWAAFGPTTVTTMEVENAMTVGDAEWALQLSKNIRHTERLPLSNWTRHLLTVAEAQAATRDYVSAVRTMQGVRVLTPEWLRNQRLARHITQDLLDATSVRRAKNLGLSELAKFIGVQP